MPGLPLGDCSRCGRARRPLLPDGICAGCHCVQRQASRGRLDLWTGAQVKALRAALSVPGRTQTAALEAAAKATGKTRDACREQACRHGWLVPGQPFVPLELDRKEAPDA